MPEVWPIPEELLHSEAEHIAEHYRVSHDEAVEALGRAFAARTLLARRIRERHTDEDVTRWRDYREVVRVCRKQIYYDLRRYYTDPDATDRLLAEFENSVTNTGASDRAEGLRRMLLKAHTSTRERLSNYEAFYEQLFGLVEAPASVLDLGCGMHPLSYPFEGQGSATKRYVAVDKDARALRAVRAHAALIGPARLMPVQASLETPDWQTSLPGKEVFALAFMLKVVPVLTRLDKPAAEHLAATVPARRVLLTGSAEAMTKKQSVERRERGVLRRFITASARQVVAEFRVGKEFGYLVE